MGVEARQIGLDIPLETLQSLRFAHAILESSHAVHVPPATQPAWEYLAQTFPVAPQLGFEGVPMLRDLEIEHTQPLCRIADISRPLLYPRAVAEWCRAHWAESRPLRFGFRGLITERRAACLQEWGRAALGRASFQVRRNPHSLAGRIVNKASGGALARTAPRGTGAWIVDSGGGRVWPNKAWDAAYYEEMCRTEFALCPDGDSVWTYRFFEAALCGAIPVVQNTCAHYQGFAFRTMTEPVSALSWSREEAEANFALALSRLTIERDELDAALLRAL